MTLSVFLAGEGRTELGGWFDAAPYRAEPPARGVLQALLAHACTARWEVRDASPWKDVPLYASGDHASPEERRALRHILLARERGCQVVVFARDTDRDRDRQQQLERAIEQAPAKVPECPHVVGAPAVPNIEAWVLALQGVRGTEAMRAGAQARLVAAITKITKGAPGYVEAMVSAVDASEGFAKVPDDAEGLLRWRDRALKLPVADTAS